MKTKVLFLSGNRENYEDAEDLIQKLKNGYVLKFAFEFRARLLPAPEFLLRIGIVVNTGNHQSIFSTLCQLKRVEHIHSVEMPPNMLGGGLVKIENNKLVFFGSSHKYGDYNKELLALGEYDEIKNTFGVEGVEFK